MKQVTNFNKCLVKRKKKYLRNILFLIVFFFGVLEGVNIALTFGLARGELHAYATNPCNLHAQNPLIMFTFNIVLWAKR